mmetsp:Transcript_24712/g.53847  ORF Transcript_24712/g.53847 Transcript_24712/m.53847 type:complete len:370 (-) Transcript_24712:2001-3110(-)
MGAGCSSTAAAVQNSSTPTASGRNGATSSSRSGQGPSSGRSTQTSTSTRARATGRSSTGSAFRGSRSRSSATSERERRRERERAEIDNLQRELAAMEELFTQLLGNVLREIQEEEEGAGPPPASAQAIRRLPTIVVAAEDLIDEQNRQCSVCFGDCHVGHKMVRLPCGHLFHGACIGPWLYKRCTCPVCRYEMPTDSDEYEEGRKERMRSRRPRLRRHELDRMKMRELNDLAYERLELSSRSALTEKSDLIDQIISSGKVDVIASPDPIEYCLAELRAMGVGKLRKEMEKAGVFFDPVDVIEKEDMVQLFVQSGRVALLDRPENNRAREVRDDVESGGVEVIPVATGQTRSIIGELAFESVSSERSNDD